MLECPKMDVADFRIEIKQSSCCVKLFYVIQKTLDLPHNKRQSRTNMASCTCNIWPSIWSCRVWESNLFMSPQFQWKEPLNSPCLPWSRTSWGRRAWPDFIGEYPPTCWRLSQLSASPTSPMSTQGFSWEWTSRVGGPQNRNEPKNTVWGTCRCVGMSGIRNLDCGLIFDPRITGLEFLVQGKWDRTPSLGSCYS